jgi:hypothetical protein
MHENRMNLDRTLIDPLDVVTAWILRDVTGVGRCFGKWVDRVRMLRDDLRDWVGKSRNDDLFFFSNGRITCSL